MSNNRLHFIFLTVFLIITLGMAGYTGFTIATGNAIETDIMALLPDNEANAILRQADEQFAKNMERRLVIVIASKDAEAAANLAHIILDHLKNSNLFIINDAVSNAQQTLETLKFYRNHKAALLTAQQRKWLQTDSTDAIRNHGFTKLYTIAGNSALYDLQTDPFLFFDEYIADNIQGEFADFTLVKDVPVLHKNGEYYAIIRADLAQSPFSITYQQRAIQILDYIQDEVVKTDPTIKILRSSLLFHADYGTQTAKQEISRMGTLSILGVFLLFLIVFKSLKPFIIVTLGITGGAIAGLAACLFIFSEIHILTLVFGTSLVGISIDYALHFLSEKYAGDEWNARQAVHNIFPGITMGLITSMIGFLGLCLTPITVLHQMAVFSIAGLCFVYACVVLVYPYVFKSLKAKPNKKIFPYVQNYKILCQRVPYRLFMTLTITSIVGLTFALPFLPARDDIRAMQMPSSKLLQNDMEIARLNGAPLSLQMLAVTGSNDQDMLDKQGEIVKHLKGDYIALSRYVMPYQTQQENLEIIRSFVSRNEKFVQQFFDEIGLPDNYYQGYQNHLNDQEPFTFHDYKMANSNDNINMLYGHIASGQSIGFIILKDPNDIANATTIAANDNDVYFIDKVESLSASLEKFRRWAGFLAIAAYVVITLLLILRYGVKIGLTITLPCILAALVTLAFVTALNGSYSLFHVLALFLVMGIGVDYGIFLTESHKARYSSAHINRVMTAIALSALTTLMSFGLLSGSTTSALHDFGLAVIVGIITIFIASPCALLHNDRAKPYSND